MLFPNQAFPSPPSQIYLAQIKLNQTAKDKESSDVGSFPWWALGGAVLSLFLYQYTANVITEGPLMPIINICLIGAIGYYMIFKSK